MSVKSFSDPQEARDEYGPLLPVEAWEVAYTDPRKQTVCLILTPRSEDHAAYLPKAYHFARQDLIQMATEVLRHLAPTTEDEILATLKRVESRLSERV